MELVVLVLNQTDALNELLHQFVEEKISGATVIDSSGMGHIIANQVPMFAMFAELKKEREDHSKTILTVVKNAEEREHVLRVVESVLGDITQPNTAVFFSLPVAFAKGIYEESGDNQ